MTPFLKGFGITLLLFTGAALIIGFVAGCAILGGILFDEAGSIIGALASTTLVLCSIAGVITACDERDNRT